MTTGMERKEQEGSTDIFWSREPIMGPKGTKENPAIIPSFNTSRCVGLETEQVRPPAAPRRRAAAARSTLLRSASFSPTRAMPSLALCCRMRAKRSEADRGGAVSLHHCPQGVIWFRLEKGPLHLVADQYFKLEQIDGGDH